MEEVTVWPGGGHSDFHIQTQTLANCGEMEKASSEG
jgi:hypothetical protein